MVEARTIAEPIKKKSNLQYWVLGGVFLTIIIGAFIIELLPRPQ